MIFKIKLILMAIALVGASGALWYVNHLRSENAILSANAAVKDGVISSLNAEIETRNADAELKAQQLRKRMSQIASLTKTTATLNRKLKEATQDDETVTQCLAVRPGADYISRLREYTQGAGNEGTGEALP